MPDLIIEEHAELAFFGFSIEARANYSPKSVEKKLNDLKNQIDLIFQRHRLSAVAVFFCDSSMCTLMYFYKSKLIINRKIDNIFLLQKCCG